MSFSEVEALGSGVGIASASLGHNAPTLGHNAAGLGLGTTGLGHTKSNLGQRLPSFSHTTHSIGQSPPALGHCPPDVGQSSAVGTDLNGVGAVPDQSTQPAPASFSSSSSSSSSSSTAFAGFQAAAPPLTSPTVNFTPVSRPNIVSMRGIGGFTSPTLSPPPVVTAISIASTLGNPQMPSITCFNSRAPMGFNFRMAGSHLSGVPIVYKRKPEDEPEEAKPLAKQHISEERMAAHLNSLHLSESFCNHRLGKRGWSDKEAVLDMDEDQGIGEDEQGLPTAEISKDAMRLIIADEVKQIVPGEPQLPPQLFKKLTQPKMEVVLWQPPGDVIRNIITASVNLQLAKESARCAAAVVPPPSTEASTSSTSPGDASNSSSPDSGVSVTSPPPSLSFTGQEAAGSASSFTSSTSSDMDDLLSLPSTSSGSRGGYLPPLRRPASPIPDPMVDDDFSERMEFNNNNDNAPNYMWLEENNNSALIDLNAIEPHRAPHLEDLPDLPDSDDMDL